MKKSQAATLTRTNMLIFFIILLGLLTVATALLLNSSKQNKLAIEKNASVVTPNASSPYSDISRVTLEGAKQAYDADLVIFVDVRDPASYVKSHVKGAINIPYSQVEDRSSELDPNTWIITYCT